MGGPRVRRGGYRCEFCSRVLVSTQALAIHQKTLHSVAIREKNKPKITLRTKSKHNQKPAKETMKKTVVVKPQKSKERLSTRLSNEEDAKKSVKSDDLESSGIKPLGVRKVEFKCPKCDKHYPVYFSVLRHIQKFHCVNSEGETVPPDSPDIIQPIQMELCLRCNTMCTDTHQCEEPDSIALTYICTGCDQSFNSMKVFDVHVAGVHKEGVETMFFPSNDEFTNWKQQMETQTKCKYTMIRKDDTKQSYRCGHTFPETEDSTIHFCPSTISSQEFSKGIQVHFYKQHCSHISNPYVLSDKYKSYSITDILTQANGYSSIADVKSDDNDPYMQFKMLMEAVILGAAKVRMDTLNDLVGKALQMTSTLTNYNEEQEPVTGEKTMVSLKRKVSDEDVTLALKSLERANVSPKRLKTYPAIHKSKKVNSFSLADSKDSDKILKELDEKKTNIKQEVKNNMVESPRSLRVKFDQSPSFVDTYKEFIGKSLEKTKKQSERKKEVVKTRIGQFKPSVSPKSPNKTRTESLDRSFGKIKDLEYEVQERENDCNILILKI